MPSLPPFPGSVAASRVVAIAAGLAFPVVAAAEPFAVMTYNVQGLPAGVIDDRTEQIQAIAPLLEDFHTPIGPYIGIPSVVALQEVFDAGYYKTLFAPETITYPYITDKDEGGPAGLGDGLNLMSDFPIEEFTRVQWDTCAGSDGQDGGDCDTNKGFTFARVQLAPAASVDVYTFDADAGDDEKSREARRANIRQLKLSILANSPDGTPVIVLGDSNALYTRFDEDNLQELLGGAGLTDVWVQLRRSGIVPPAGSPIDADCPTDPGSAGCELVDKVLYRDGSTLVFAPSSYAALKETFSDEKGNGLSDRTPVAVTFDWAIVTTTTTTTSSTSTSSTSTSTTLPPDRPCGDPVALVVKLSATGPGESRAVAAGDALFALKAAVGQVECALCTCDVDSNGNVTASDALKVLKAAVGQPVTLTCPPC